MIGHERFIAVDWGTTNRRAWRIGPDGAVEDVFEDDAGVAALPSGAYPSEVEKLRQRLGDLPMLLGGMVGSNRGWRDVPYVACPAAVADIAPAIVWMDERTGIVPGVCQNRADAPEVMRGEEVQIIGAMAAGGLPADGLVCLPGTHAKWVCLAGGRIESFATWMTGEVFALLGRHSILAPQIAGKAQSGSGFAAGVAQAQSGDPLGRLFRLRAGALLGTPIADGPSYASGLLIGAEVRAALALRQGDAPYLIGRPDLCELYAATIAQVQDRPFDAHRQIDGGLAFREGIRALLKELA